MTRRSPDIADLFYAASEWQDEEQRSAYLDEACGTDAALRRRIEELLAAVPKVGRFLETPPIASPLGINTGRDGETSGSVIGPYRLLEQIGEGGMGVVYLAEQVHPVRRKVALKIVKPGMDTEYVVARFEAERQALALMDHPHIARVIDGGATPTGRSYFVMELVPGDPITEFCDRERLTTPDRLNLFVLVCRAVQHAHQKGIIHRDLKPSNILVARQDGVPVPKVIDFGIAKAIDRSLTDRNMFTGRWQIIGTPRYMSPEQAALGGTDIDTRSDIYSLGSLLYELLTGSTPFDEQTLKQTTFDGIRRIILQHEPPWPSIRLGGLGARLAIVSAQRRAEPRKLVGAVRGELDWIVMKCLEKDRTRRYETANGLARDLMRHLADQPVEACPPSLLYRSSKYVRRNRAALAVVSVVALALVASTAISTRQAIRATRAEQRTAAALDEAKRQRRVSERHLYATRLRFAHQTLELGQLDRAREILADLDAEPGGFAAGEFARGYVRGRAWGVLRPVGREGEAGESAVPSPDGRFLASFDHQGPIHLIETATLRHQAALATPGTIHPQEVHFAADGGRLTAIEHRDILGAARRAWIWEVPSGRMLLEFHPPAGRRTEWLSLCPGGHLLSETTPLEGGKLRADLWDFSNTSLPPRRIATLSEDYSWVEISADGRRLAIVTPDRIVVRDSQTGAETRSMGKGSRDGLEWRPSFSADGRTLITRSIRRVEFWDLATGTLAARRDLDGSTPLDRVWTSPDGGTVGLLKTKGNIELWSRQTGRSRTVAARAFAKPYDHICRRTDDGRRLVIFGGDASHGWVSVRTLDLDTATVRAMNVLDRLQTRCAHLLPDQRHLLLARSPVAEIWRFDPEAPDALAGHADEAWALAFSPDCRILATGSDDSVPDDTIKLWDPATGRLLTSWRAGAGTVSSLAFSPDGRTLVAATLSPSRNLQFWDVASGRLMATPEGHRDRVRSVAFSPDGTRLASAGSDRTIRLWDARGGGPLLTLSGHPDTVREVVFSPDGRILASASNDATVRLWEVGSGRMIREVPTLKKCSAVAFSPDGSLLASADEGGDIMLWDAATGDRKIRIHSDRDRLFTLAFSPDGRALAAAGSSRIVRVWDVLTGQELLSLSGHAAQVNDLAFSPDGRTLASCSHDGAVRLWRSEETRSSP